MKINFLFIALCLVGTSLNIQKNLKTASTVSPPVVISPGPVPVSTPEWTYFKSVLITGSTNDAAKWFQKSDQTFINDIDKGTQPNGYCTKVNIDFKNFGNNITCGGPKSNIGFIQIIRFCADRDDAVNFHLHLDNGTGTAVTFEGKVLTRVKNDLWWGGSNLSSVSITQPLVFTKKGLYQIEIHGGEYCCDGNQKIQINYNTKPYVDVNPANLSQKCKDLDIPFPTDPIIPVPVVPTDCTDKDDNDDDDGNGHGHGHP